jgi:hypothetical protein
MGKPGTSFSSKNTSLKMVIGTDKISEIVNDSDADGGSFSELSDSDTCKVNSPFSSSNSRAEEEGGWGAQFWLESFLGFEPRMVMSS